MAMKVVLLLALVAVLLLSGEAIPASSLNGGIKESRILPPQHLFRQQPFRREGPGALQTRPVRSPVSNRLAQLSEDERDVMTKQIMNGISVIMNSDCMADQDYKGWVDWGRRNAE